jgi:predicted nucleic acid-binding Zn ribbon protein
MERQQIRSTVMNTIIYIVGLVVVIGIVLSFFGLR